jgi:hypothetical protein
MGGGPARTAPRGGRRGALEGSGTGRGARPVGVRDSHPACAPGQGMKGWGFGQGGPRLGRCHGPAHAHSANFDLKRISKLNTI